MIRIIKHNEIPSSFFETRSLGDDIHEIVNNILQNVKSNGDSAIREYATKFDRANPQKLEIPHDYLKLCADKLKERKPDLYDALTYSFTLAKNFAQKQKECFTDFETELVPGVITGQKNIPVERAGLYIPAGKFPLMSSVIMCAAPATVAPCKEIILCTPPRLHPSAKGNPNSPHATKPWADSGILAAAYICGVHKVFACGGAQAIAAMTYGTQTVPKCDVIVGPGNKFVAEAKKIIFGTVGIDMIAGPTEVLIIANDSANPEWVAADMLAQAEHDTDAQSVLVTTSSFLAQKVAEEIQKQLSHLPTAATAKASIEKNGLIILCENLAQAAEIANKKAPEHLELAMDNNDQRK
ncbi:MAG: histidinol dehydrogenase, partial [Treponema sp.]|nr:histidinol dehydrogenase [Treponema sp.]